MVKTSGKYLHAFRQVTILWLCER